MKRPAILNARFCETINRPGVYGDGHGGHGLILRVHRMENGRLSKTWIQRVRIHGRPTHISLGSYPILTLSEARAKVIENKRLFIEGRDPRGGGIPSFEEAAEKVIAIHAEGWKDEGKSAAQWRASLRDYVFPKLGRKRVNEITTADVMDVLLPIWRTKHETARRVRQRIRAIMRWSIAQGYRVDDPAGEQLGAALPKNGNPRQHHRALHYSQVADAIARVQSSGAFPSTIFALELLVLTATRSGEVRGARWDEIDLEARTWTIPAERMKAKRPHRVPLTRRSLEVLSEARAFDFGSGLVFPNTRGQMLSDSTMSKLLREIGTAAVPHGFRSSFRQWAAERTNVPREVAEQALAHVNKDKVEAAYQRSDLFEHRRKLMDSWARYLQAEAGNVVALHG